ncbi:MAG: phosphate ABC transporter substrate-binding protein [Aggregatilineales bacterium]
MGRARRTLAIVAFTLVSCSAPVVPVATPTTEIVPLRLYATNAMLSLTSDLTMRYHQANPAITFELASGNYAALLERLLAGEMSYFISNHLPLEDDLALWAAPIGQDGIAVIVHPDNPVTALSTGQLREIYQGRIEDWSAFGFDAPITVFSREAGSGTRAEFELLVLGDRPITPGARIAPTSEAMVRSVARTPGGIGYVSMGFLDDRVRALMIDGVSLSQNSVAANIYPLRAFIYVVGRDEPETDFRAFVAWVQSPEGQAVVGRHAAPLLDLSDG